ncbi:hypothetical protein GCM10009609_74660 [Pseudonocardia aurantiaca]
MFPAQPFHGPVLILPKQPCSAAHVRADSAKQSSCLPGGFSVSRPLNPPGTNKTLIGRFMTDPSSLPKTCVRVLSPFIGGRFGAGLRAWPRRDTQRRSGN